MQPVEQIVSRILLVRGQKVMLDTDLAELYGISTGRFNQQVRRNRDRFPSDFMFQLTNPEVERLRSQIGDGSSFSVERMTVTGHVRPQTNEGGRPEQHGGRVRAGAAAAEHLPEKASHGFDGVGGSWQAETRVHEVSTVELQTVQEFADRCLDSLSPAVAVRQAP